MKKIEWSERLKRLPPYLFAEIDKKKNALRRKGIKFIDLSIGDPDILAPKRVVEALCGAAKLKENQKYALDQGSFEFRNSIKKWTKRRFGVSLNAEKEVLPLIGSKEGLVHFPLGVVNRGEYVIVPSPGYPGYRSAAILSGAKVYETPLREENGFLPLLEKIPLSVRNKAQLFYLNYPNNPTTALAPVVFLKKLVKFCSKYGVILAYDNAYSEIYFKDVPHSILEIKGAREIALEFHSLSKTFCMTGFRVGWASGCKDLIKILLKVKANVDSGIFGAVQTAAAAALDKESNYVRLLRKILKERRDYFTTNLKREGFGRIYSDSTFYVWVKIPSMFRSSVEFTRYLLTKKNIVVAPGAGFGKYGEGFIRFALTVDKKILEKVFKDKILG